MSVDVATGEGGGSPLPTWEGIAALSEEDRQDLERLPAWVLRACEDHERGTPEREVAELVGIHHIGLADLGVRVVVTYKNDNLARALKAHPVKCSSCVENHGVEAAFPAVGFAISESKHEESGEAFKGCERLNRHWVSSAGPWGAIASFGLALCAHHLMELLLMPLISDGVAPLDCLDAAEKTETHEMLKHYAAETTEQIETRNREDQGLWCWACGKHAGINRWRFSCDPIPYFLDEEPREIEWVVCAKCRDLIVLADELGPVSAPVRKLALVSLKGLVVPSLPSDKDSIRKLKRSGDYAATLAQLVDFWGYLVHRLDAPVKDHPSLWSKAERNRDHDARLVMPLLCSHCYYERSTHDGTRCFEGRAPVWVEEARKRRRRS